MPRRRVLAGAAVLLAASATAVAVAALSSRPSTSAAADKAVPNTAKVEERELSARVSENGILTYQAQADGSSYSVIDQARGIYTGLPEVGQVISQGQALYRIDESPVVLLYGTTPAYRTLVPGTAGGDVAQLNADLVALGDATSSEIPSGSDVFTGVTAAAVAKLQAALGVVQDGILTLGQAVFMQGALRVTDVSMPLGGMASAGQAVLQGTSTTRVVTIDLDAAQQSLVKAGDPVSISLPDGHSTPGVISAVGTVATVPAANPNGGSAAAPTVKVLVTPTDAASTGSWDRAPVKVTITTGSVRSALVVPIDALLAQAGGGYAVEVVGANGGDRLVPVSLGLFDDAGGLVQVSGSTLAAGQRVVVPAL